nr:unnamed protein product [Callosobruchus chinensis]
MAATKRNAGLTSAVPRATLNDEELSLKVIDWWTKFKKILEITLAWITSSQISISLILGFSDHLAVSFNFNCTCEKPRKTKITYRPITDEGLLFLYNKIENINWHLLFNQDWNIEGKFSTFLDSIIRCVDSSLPDM